MTKQSRFSCTGGFEIGSMQAQSGLRSLRCPDSFPDQGEIITLGLYLVTGQTVEAGIVSSRFREARRLLLRARTTSCALFGKLDVGAGEDGHMNRKILYSPVLLVLAATVCLSLSRSAWAGTAYYGGFTEETGVFAWRVVPNPLPALYLSRKNPGWEIGSSSGTPIGALTLEDGTDLIIPAASDFVLTAFWNVPRNPIELSGRECYLYIGPEFGGVDTSKTRLGIEWKALAPGGEKKWYIRMQMQMLASDIEAPTGISRLGVKFQRMGNRCYHWYSVNDGPWQVYLNGVRAGFIPLDSLWPWQDLPVVVTFSVRGMGTHKMDTLITGPGVPDVNMGTASDTDSDGLPDYWETHYFGNLDQGPSDDPDGDGKTNLQEFQEGTNPHLGLDPDPEPPVPSTTYYGLAALSVLIAATMGAARRGAA